MTFCFRRNKKVFRSHFSRLKLDNNEYKQNVYDSTNNSSLFLKPQKQHQLQYNYMIFAYSTCIRIKFIDLRFDLQSFRGENYILEKENMLSSSGSVDILRVRKHRVETREVSAASVDHSRPNSAGEQLMTSRLAEVPHKINRGT